MAYTPGIDTAELLPAESILLSAAPLILRPDREILYRYEYLIVGDATGGSLTPARSEVSSIF